LVETRSDILSVLAAPLSSFSWRPIATSWDEMPRARAWILVESWRGRSASPRSGGPCVRLHVSVWANGRAKTSSGRRNGAHGLSRKRHAVRSGECAGQRGEDRQVGVEPNQIQATDAESEQCPLVREAPELALDGVTAAAELA
jgi:hypothetical protein